MMAYTRFSSDRRAKTARQLTLTLFGHTLAIPSVKKVVGGMDIRLGPIAGKARIDVLDVLRGLAILGILYMNIPFMGQQIILFMTDPRMIGWSVADRNVWVFIQTFLDGTQRGMLEFLFGAGMMVLTARAMEPDGPVAVADLYFRRSLWLLLFGMLDIFALLWAGDILHTYAIAGLFLFPFRKLKAKHLLGLGLALAAIPQVMGAVEYVERAHLIVKVEAVHDKQAAKAKLTKDDKAILKDWQEKLDTFKLDKKKREQFAQEKTGHTGFSNYVSWNWASWMQVWIGKNVFFASIFEAFTAMLIGVGLFKLGIIQGQRSPAFYLRLMVVAYAVGLGLRGFGTWERMTFAPIPKTLWFTFEYGRLAVTLGHLALVNYAMQTGPGRRLLAPFKAAGRTAFSLYVMQTLIGMWLLFAPFGLNLWAQFGWAQLAAIATGIIALQVVIANLWLRHFTMGPLEWLWRSLCYWRRQPFRLPAAPRRDPGLSPA